MAERLRSVSHLFKLVDACNRCSTVFRIANERLRDDRFEDFAEHLRQTLDRFVFELQKEGGRNGAEDLGGPRTYEMKISSTNPMVLRVQACNELQHALEGYDALLAGGIAGHARAMIRRQRQSLTKFLHDLEYLTAA